MFAEVLAGISIAQRPKRYVPFSQAKTQLQQHAQPLSTLKQFNPLCSRKYTQKIS